MSDTKSLQTLQRLVQRECRSLMQYILGAYPWTTSRHSEEVGQLLGMVEAERDAMTALIRHLYRHKIPQPHSGGYPTDFTSLNFADLHYLAGVLARSQEDNIVRLKDDLGMVHDAEGKHLAQELLVLKVKHLDALRKLASPEHTVMA